MIDVIKRPILGLWSWLWNQVRPVAFKEYIHMLNDPTTLRIAILLPIIQTIMFGFAINMDVENVPTVIYNQDGRPASFELVKGLENTTYFEVQSDVHTKEAVLSSIRRGDAKIGVVIPPDYSDNLNAGRPATFQVLIDGSESNTATQTLAVANQYASAVSAAVDNAKKVASQSIDGGPAVSAATHVLYNPDLETTVFTIPGLLGVVLMNTTLFLTLLALVKEREYGTLDQLLVTPLTPSGLVVGKIIPYIFLGFFDFNLVIAAMLFLFGVPIAGNVLLLEACALLFLMSMLGVGLLISARSESQMQAAQVAQLVVLPSILMSGFVFSIDSMPPAMQFISKMMPLTYFLQVLRGIILRGATLHDLIFPIGMLTVIGVGILSISIISFKRQMN
jgi:ABC-type multidrug transport system permease subunit